MQLHWFTIACLATLLIPLGQFIWALRLDSAATVARRFIVTVAAGVIAFGMLGAAIVQGDSDLLFGFARDRLFFRQFDASSLHYLTLVAMVCGLVAISVRQVGVVGLAIVAAILGGAALPAAMKWVWFGPLMRGGVIDIGGAAPLHLLGGACALAITRLTTRAEPGEVADQSPRPFAFAPVGSILIALGWIACALVVGVMQSPATAGQGALNSLRAAATAAVVGMFVARFSGERDPARAVTVSIVLALVAISAAGGRAPVGIALFLGGFAAVVAPFLDRFMQRFVGLNDRAGLLMPHFAGGLIALFAAAPFAGEAADPLMQLGVQGITAFLAGAIGLFLGLSLGLLLSAAQRIRIRGESFAESDVR